MLQYYKLDYNYREAICDVDCTVYLNFNHQNEIRLYVCGWYKA